MNKIITAAIALVTLAVFSGCSSISNIKKDDTGETTKRESKISTEDLNAIPGIVKIPISRKAKYFSIQEPKLLESNRQISIQFANPVQFKRIIKAIADELNLNIGFNYADIRGDATTSVTQQFTRQPATQTNLSTQTLQTTAKTTGIDSIDYFDRQMSLKFKGSIKELFDIMADTTGYFYSIRGNNLTIKERQTFKIMIPNYPEIIKEVNTSLEKLGASDIAIDEVTNNITFTANYPAYKRIVDYTDDIRNNLALVTMRIIIINVDLTGSENFGIDWSKIVLGYKSQQQTPFGIQNLNNSNSSTGTSSTSTTTTATASSGISGMVEGVGALFNTQGTNLYIQGANFTLSAFANLLQSYGKTSIVQNVNIQTLSGKKGKITSITETPYVKDVGVNSLSNNSAATTSAATTAMAKDGVELEILPRYSKDEGTLTIQMVLGIYGTGQFLTLQAGTLGTLSQPIETTKKIENVLRMTPSQISITGGLMFDKKINSTNGLGLNNYLTDSMNNSVSKEELIIIVKPQIYQFEETDI